MLRHLAARQWGSAAVPDVAVVGEVAELYGGHRFQCSLSVRVSLPLVSRLARGLSAAGPSPADASSRLQSGARSLLESCPADAAKGGGRAQAQLARQHPELAEALCVELLQRHRDHAALALQPALLACARPWLEGLALTRSRESVSPLTGRLLAGLLHVTRHAPAHARATVESLWRTLATTVRVG